MEIKILLRYLKNILIYEQFLWNGSETMAPEWLFEKISDFQNMNIIIIYQYSFEARDLEISNM